MSTEVKIVYADVESKLVEITDTSNALNPKAEPPITGNTLDVVTKLTELSTQLEELLTKYQTVLNTNMLATSNSIGFMKEADRTISNAMQCTVPGTKKVMQ